MGSRVFAPSDLNPFFHRYPAPAYVIAYSGGLDSHVLLHACADLQQNGQLPAVRAVHINHGLQPAAADWAQHGQAICQALGILLQVVTLQLQVPAGESLEAVAREARYAV
ncbi:MAG: ATP-binding protein [Thiolinea sp.]